jgi:aminoglycoside/choline kinase family phosphotransferase
LSEQTGKYPLTVEGWTPGLLTELLRQQRPEVEVTAVNVVERNLYGEGMVSTAARITLDLDYAAPTDLPQRVMVKIAQTVLAAQPLYENEVAFYTKLRPELDVEAPRAFGGGFDPESGTFALVMEDLRQRGVRFPNVTMDVPLESIRDLIDTLARLHARYWQSPRFAVDLNWVQTHMAGSLHHMFHNPAYVPANIAERVQTEQFKREMVQRLGLSVDQLYDGFRAVQAHQATLPQTIVHGDTHIGNTFLLPDGRGGLLDWQLCVRGYCLHDVGYLIATGLTVQDRRQNERDLLDHYLDRLKAHGVADAPSREQVWTEYRRAAVWNVYIGWLTTPTVNYGWEISVMAHLRVMTAFEDLETAKLLASMP